MNPFRDGPVAHREVRVVREYYADAGKVLTELVNAGYQIVMCVGDSSGGYGLWTLVKEYPA